MERNSFVNLVTSNLCFCLYFILDFFMGKCNLNVKQYLNDHATLIFNIILTFYFSLFKTLSFSYKSQLVKTNFIIFNKFKVLFTLEIEQLKYKST